MCDCRLASSSYKQTFCAPFFFPHTHTYTPTPAPPFTQQTRTTRTTTNPCCKNSNTPAVRKKNNREFGRAPFSAGLHQHHQHNHQRWQQITHTHAHTHTHKHTSKQQRQKNAHDRFSSRKAAAPAGVACAEQGRWVVQSGCPKRPTSAVHARHACVSALSVCIQSTGSACVYCAPTATTGTVAEVCARTSWLVSVVVVGKVMCFGSLFGLMAFRHVVHVCVVAAATGRFVCRSVMARIVCG